jgi:hypothetical protein
MQSSSSTAGPGAPIAVRSSPRSPERANRCGRSASKWSRCRSTMKRCPRCPGGSMAAGHDPCTGRTLVCGPDRNRGRVLGGRGGRPVRSRHHDVDGVARGVESRAAPVGGRTPRSDQRIARARHRSGRDGYSSGHEAGSHLTSVIVSTDRGRLRPGSHRGHLARRRRHNSARPVTDINAVTSVTRKTTSACPLSGGTTRDSGDREAAARRAGSAAARLRAR